MLTEKCYAIDHLCEAILEVGGVESLYGGVYVASYKRFKSFYVSSSSWRTVMDENVVMQKTENAEDVKKFF